MLATVVAARGRLSSAPAASASEATEVDALLRAATGELCLPSSESATDGSDRDAAVDVRPLPPPPAFAASFGGPSTGNCAKLGCVYQNSKKDLGRHKSSATCLARSHSKVTNAPIGRNGEAAILSTIARFFLSLSSALLNCFSSDFVFLPNCFAMSILRFKVGSFASTGARPTSRRSKPRSLTIKVTSATL